MKFGTFLLGLFTPLMFAIGAEFSGPPVTLNGVVETFFFKNGNPDSYTRSFQVVVDGCKVFIHSEPGPRDKGVAYIEFGSDGTNAHTFTRYKKNANSELPKTGASDKRLVNDSLLTVSAQLCPSPYTEWIAPVWLAYGSHCYLTNRPSKTIHCLWIAPNAQFRGFEPHMELEANWSFEAEQGRFLETLTDYRKGSIIRDNGETLPFPDNTADGHTNTAFRVLNWTNVQGVIIPSRFEYLSFSAAPPGTTSKMLGRRVGTVNEVFVGRGRESFLPEMTRAVSVIDFSMKTESGNQIDYLAKDKRLLTRDEITAKLKLIGEENQKRLHAKGINRRIVLRLLIGAVVLTLIGFVANVYWQQYRVNKKK